MLNITEDTANYAKAIKDILEKENFRVEADLRNETLQRKIREKEMRKVPYMVIVGKKELETRQISVRGRGMQNLGNMDIEGFLALLKKEPAG